MFKQSIPTHGMPIPCNPEQAARFKRAEEYAAQIESPMEMLLSANTLTVDSLRASCADEVVFLQYKTGD